MKPSRSANLLLSLALALLITSCSRHTGKLASEQEARFAKEGIVHRADDLTFRRTIPAGQRDSGWSDRRASIVVTHDSVFLHVNSKPLVEITPRSTGFYEVHRDHDRVSLRAGSGKSAAIWSFHPSDGAELWTTDIRAVIRKAKSR
jgi:hypothetical protein